jgi:hypothetical protein
MRGRLLNSVEERKNIMKENIVTAVFIFAALALFAVPADAAKQVNDVTDIDLTVFIPCADGGAGELVDLSGRLHTLITLTINGNNVSGTAHFQPQGISGTGETTGDKYQATGVTKDSSFKGSFQNGQFNQTFVNNFRIIGQGPGNNYLVHETLHIAFNAKGTLTVFHDNLSVDCK